MRRKPRKTQTIAVDPLYPLDKEKLQTMVKDNDCFGKGWSASESACSICHDSIACSVIYQDIRKSKEKELSKKQGPYLDEVKKLTPEQLDKVENIIKETHEDGEPTTVDEMVQFFMKKMCTKDELVATEAIREFITSRVNVYTKKGLFYHKTLA